ncbi:hypothetical protein A6R79_01650 [Xanthomonas translucens pv. translucens]|nr:hypothetical protein A6R79_01650 [Xanthomonas translucens pv. translucens]
MPAMASVRVASSTMPSFSVVAAGLVKLALPNVTEETVTPENRMSADISRSEAAAFSMISSVWE